MFKAWVHTDGCREGAILRELLKHCAWYKTILALIHGSFLMSCVPHVQIYGNDIGAVQQRKALHQNWITGAKCMEGRVAFLSSKNICCFRICQW